MVDVVLRKAERIAQNGINGVNRGTTKPIISAKSGIISRELMNKTGMKKVIVGCGPTGCC